MFDPSQQLHDHFVGQGMSDLEAHREANKVSGRCPIGWRAHNQTERDSVNVAVIQTKMDNTTQEETDSQIIDLGFDISEADVLFPVIKNGYYPARIDTVKQEMSKKQVPMLLVRYQLTEPTVDISGREVKGLYLTQRITTQPTGKLTQDQIKRNVGRIQIAAVGPGRVTTAEWVGKIVRLRVALREPHRDEVTGEEYPASNEVAGVLPLAQTAEAVA
jgi:hypothetical protein